MDGSKNAMYAQAGRSMSRSRVTEKPAARVAEKKPVAMAAPQFAAVPAANPTSVQEPVFIPVRIPDQEPVSVLVQEPVTVTAPASVPSPAVPPQGHAPAVMSAPAHAQAPPPATVPAPMMIEPAAAEMETSLPPLPGSPVIVPAAAGDDGCSLLAMAFMEMQEWHGLYELEHGFSRGTIFEDLDLPFMGEGACRRE